FPPLQPPTPPSPLSLHDALPIYPRPRAHPGPPFPFLDAADDEQSLSWPNEPELARLPLDESVRPDDAEPSGERGFLAREPRDLRSEEHTSELQSLRHLVCRRLLE